MTQPIVTGPRRGGGRRVIGALAVLVGGIAAVVAAFFVLVSGGLVASPASVIEAPVRAATPAGDRVFLMTSQWRTVRSRASRSGSSYTRLYVDVWGFDAAGARPAWRSRIADDRGGVNMGRKLLGVQAGTLWLLDGKGLVGLSLKDGARIADTATIEAANAPLKGLMPKEDRYYRFDQDGLSFTAADGERWRMTGQGVQAAPTGPIPGNARDPRPPAPGVVFPARIAGGNGSWAFYSRGLPIGPRWLGMLSEAEVPAFQQGGTIGGVDPERYPKMRVWRASIGQRSTFFGPKPTFSDFRPLPESPEFLQAGLLQDGRCCGDIPVLLSKPDSVLVLHKDRLGEGGRFRLTRVTGPLGKPMWTVDLPATAIEAVMPGEGAIVLLGRRDEDPGWGGRDDRAVSVDQLISVDLQTGRLSAYGFRVKPTAPSEIPASSTTLPDPGAKAN